MTSYEAVYVCTDWKQNGHTDRYGGSTTSSRSSGSGSAEAPKEERAAASAERKRVIAGNKAWKSATTVRRVWLAEFVERKTPPDDVERFIAETVAGRSHALRSAFEHRHAFYTALNADETGDYQVEIKRADALLEEIATASRGRALVITAGLILAAWEASAHDPQAWRGASVDTKRSLAAMNAWGYELSSIEQSLVDGTAWVAP